MHVFSLSTMESEQAARAKGMYVTHEGHCGSCSSLQDLVVYMKIPDLTEVGIKCGFRAILNFNDGVVCYTGYGFSEECAKIWIYDTMNTHVQCPSCIIFATSGTPSNLPAPGCGLVECIQCDEDRSGPLFKKFAGRTRRDSGLMSKIVRNCSAVPEVYHQDPCYPMTYSPRVSPTAAPPSPSSSERASMMVGVVLVLFGLLGIVA